MATDRETRHIEISTLYSLRLQFADSGKAEWTLEEILKFIDNAAISKGTA